MGFLEKRFEVRIVRDVAYATGRIKRNFSSTSRTMLLDVYEPVGAPPEPRPALVMAFGGAFHRGSKERDNFPEEGHYNTPVADYCLEFAKRGYVAFSIDYRLIQEAPDLGTTPIVTNPSSIPRRRIDVVRQMLNLPPMTTEQLWASYEAACDDLENAIIFVRASAERYRVDRSRIAVGGFSAGAWIALSVAYGAGAPVSAVISLSGHMAREDLVRYVTDATGRPPVLLVSGEHDLEEIREQAPIMADHFARVGLLHAQYVISGVDHFYSADSMITGPGERRMTLETGIAEFLYDRMALGLEPARP